MFISVIVLTYNRARLLNNCLDSLVKQKFPKTNYEIIVIDDGSTDNTSTLVNNYDVKYVKQKHAGVSATRNNGLKHAKGDVLCFVADDYILPKNYLSTINAFFKKNKSIDVVSFNICAQGNNLYSKINDLHYKTRLRGTINITNKHKNEINNILPASGAAAFKKTVFEDLGMFDEQFFCLEDLDFAIRMKFENIKHEYNSTKILRVNNKTLIPSLKEQFYKGKTFFYLKKKWGSKFKPSLKTNLLGVLTVFFATPILTLVRVMKLSFLKAALFFFFMLTLDYSFFMGYLFAYVEFFKKS